MKSVTLRFVLVVCALFASQVYASNAHYSTIVGAWKVSFPNLKTGDVVVQSKSLKTINITIYDVNPLAEVDFWFHVLSEDLKIINVTAYIPKSAFKAPLGPGHLAKWSGNLQMQAGLCGKTRIFVELRTNTSQLKISHEALNITVESEDRKKDKIYTYTAGALVLLMFLNLGTVLDLQRLKGIFLRPIGPFIGFFCRFVLMPALAVGLGRLLLRGSKELQLGLFFTALAPSGGLANICAVFLKGNINLSIATTTINSLMALAMLPLWLYALDGVVYDESALEVPFIDLAVGSVCLIVAITLGLLMRKIIPKTTKLIFKFLKPISLLLSLCLIGLSVGLNAFVFRHLTAMIIVAALILPFVGYLLSYVLSKIFQLSNTDSLTIAVETGVLNMTVPIVLLQHSLNHSSADVSMVVPITAALASLGLILIFYIVRRIFGWNVQSDIDSFDTKQLVDNEL